MDASRFAPARLLTPALVVLIGLVAAAVRIRFVLHTGALSVGGYDDGVHFAAAANLVHGSLPYRDTLFLQPPAMALAAAPFAALAEAVGDARAFAVARLAFAVLGGVNAALVVLVARRSGTVAAASAGALYAFSFPAVYAERTLTLEVLGTTGLLLALLLLDVARASPHRVWHLLAGAAAGGTVGFKIWYVVPFLVLLIGARGGRLRFLVGGAVAGSAIYLPFFLAAPDRMWAQVVMAQLNRPGDSTVDLAHRVRAALGVTAPGSMSPIAHVPGTLVATVLGAVALVLIVLAATDRRALRAVALLAATALLLAASPSFFQHYVALTAAPLALVAGIGVQRIAVLLRRRWTGAVLVVLVVVLAAGINARHDGQRQGQRAPIAGLRAAAGSIRGCVVADDPTVLILMNRLTPDLDAGCTVQADPSGAGYLLTDTAGRYDVERIEKPAYQREILRYLSSGAAFLWVRGDGLQLTPASVARLEQAPTVFSDGRWTIRASPRP